MSERAEVLREFTRTVEHCEFASDDVLYAHGMADEIVRLRSQLAAAESIAQAREVLIAALRADKDEARAELTTAKRERDEARRERDAMRDQYAMSLEEHGELMRQRQETSSQLWDCMNERDGWKHRAERMERVVLAAEDFVSFQGTQNEARHFDELVRVLAEYRLGRALDAMPTRGSDE